MDGFDEFVDWCRCVDEWYRLGVEVVCSVEAPWTICTAMTNSNAMVSNVLGIQNMAF